MSTLLKAPAIRPRRSVAASDADGVRFGAAAVRRYLVVAAGGLLAVFVVLELIVRFLVLGPGVLFTGDPDVGKKVMGGSHVLLATEGYGRTAYAVDGEIATPFTGGPNVVVLGDSHTEAYQVDDEAKFVSVAETRLRAHGRRVDLHNLGFSGGTAADYVQMAPAVVDRYRPALVVIQLTAADFGAESFDRGHVNFFEPAPTGALRLRHRTPADASPSIGARVKHASALATYLQVRLLTILEQRGSATANATVSRAQPSAPDIATLPAQLDLLRRAYDGQRVILLVLPWTPKIEGGVVRTADGDHDEFVRAITLSLHGDRRWQVVDPSAAFQELGRRAVLPRGFANTRPGSGHLNVHGHRAVGTVLADAIETLLP